ncbi:MAG: pyruvate dehydrogenase complex dihydrolipoamide acetyltransferase [Rhodospirillaceae bacterium TMED8]|nr:pyruvate dehydrogenase complex dihydrolipoamide acetyltransferase [Magnetovibrio sp.]OUT51621.1 MAG: pyruvate dehydrogenase complex dihydrolipoamide acetyltransferase [Rhodospirillaceae bacterium TMED8]
MPIEILMPALSPTMTEGSLTKWLKSEGERIDPGDILCEIETDKATMEIEAVDEGTLGKILIADGTESVSVNQVIALLLEEGEDDTVLGGISEFSLGAFSTNKTQPNPESTRGPSGNLVPKVDGDPVKTSVPRVFASPLAKRLAVQNNISLGKLEGSGPHGRIIKRDVEQAVSSSSTSVSQSKFQVGTQVSSGAAQAISTESPILSSMPEFEVFQNSSMRKRIAERLTTSARDTPHFNLSADIYVDALTSVREELNSRDHIQYKITINDLIIKAVAIALSRVPNCNVTYTNEAILRFKRFDISLAVAVEGGLVTPIIKDAGGKGLAAIAAESNELIKKARKGKLKPEQFEGGTFTISNLGMHGIKAFTSIINPPQGAILSVGVAEERAVIKSGKLAVATVMTVTLAVDHRCIDGSVAAKFINELKVVIEDPLQLML